VIEVAIVDKSDKLYRLQVDAGGDVLLQVVAGLQQHVPAAELVQRLVVVILNLKPAKLAGEVSEAMILAADVTLPDGRLLVTTLQPPEGAAPGDQVRRQAARAVRLRVAANSAHAQVYLEGSQPPAATPKTMKSDPWASVVKKLRTQDHRPTYDGVPMCTTGGALTVPKHMPDGASIH